MIATNYDNLPPILKEDAGFPQNYVCLSPEQQDLVKALSLCYKEVYEDILGEIDIFKMNLIEMGEQLHD